MFNAVSSKIKLKLKETEIKNLCANDKQFLPRLLIDTSAALCTLVNRKLRLVHLRSSNTKLMMIKRELAQSKIPSEKSPYMNKKKVSFWKRVKKSQCRIL
jgi:hypothetical protein